MIPDENYPGESYEEEDYPADMYEPVDSYTHDASYDVEAEEASGYGRRFEPEPEPDESYDDIVSLSNIQSEMEVWFLDGRKTHQT